MVSTGSARSRNKYMYIKENINQILGIKENISHRIELGVGDIKCLMWECAVYDQNLHKVHDKSFQGCTIYQPA